MKKKEEPDLDITDVVATISGLLLGSGAFMIVYWAFVARPG